MNYRFIGLKNSKSSITPLPPPPEGLFISNRLRGEAGFLERGALFYLAKKVVSALHKKLECTVENLKYKKLEVMQPRIKNKSKLATRE